MIPTRHRTRRLKKRAWLQRQTIEVLSTVPDELTAKEILHLIRSSNASPTQRGWCEATSVSMGMILREIVAQGFILRTKMPTGTYCYSSVEELDATKYNEFFGTRGLHPTHQV